MRFSTCLTVALSLLSSALHATAQNAELAALHDADQSARARPAEIDWAVLVPEDRQRRERVHALLRAGEVRAAIDYYHAAMVFQHGQHLVTSGSPTPCRPSRCRWRLKTGVSAG